MKPFEKANKEVVEATERKLTHSTLKIKLTENELSSTRDSIAWMLLIIDQIKFEICLNATFWIRRVIGRTVM